jgi:membrane protease YdiL (CAAX protease family)
LIGLAERIFGVGAIPFINMHAILISAPLTLLTTANIVIDPGPWGEETGWRGFALPRLLTRLPPLTAAIVLGVIRAIWHAPAFLVSGLTQSNYNFGWFLISATGISVLTSTFESEPDQLASVRKVFRFQPVRSLRFIDHHSD